MENTLQKLYLKTTYALIAQELLQAHYQILLLILLTKFMKLNVKMAMKTKNLKHVELKTNIERSLESTNAKDDLIL